MTTISHGAIFKRYRGRISGTFGILLVENLLQVAEPLVLGLAVNSLANGTWEGVYAFLGVTLAMVVIGTLRRRYDTRVYGGIYQELSEEVATRAIDEDEDLSPAIGQASLLKEVVDFFENELPMGFASVFGIVGALVMLLVLAPQVGAVAAVAAASIGAIFFLSRGRMIRLNGLLNDEIEARSRVFMERKRESLESHFSGVVRHTIALSDLEARNFGLSYLFVIGMITYALYYTVAVTDAQIGDVFAILTYASQFAEGVLVLPFMYQQYVRTSEITGRMNRSGETPDEVAG